MHYRSFDASRNYEGTAAFHILVVDDFLDVLSLLKIVLETEGYQVSVARDGNFALSLIQASPPDLVLLDVVMPGISGYEVTRRVRQCPRLKYLPIILFTGCTDESDREEALAAGANDIVSKPIAIVELLCKVRMLCG
ncbi:response regulator [Leptolyngbya sp. FACHB-711]|uniref:response regulator n=1 Tax=unclassified Leptolyngbya TaxID=2650499 RepID=UPI0016896FB4|nr:response regulator [Leptolyngbya sp. FACHB-711]MBD2025518.1 response regulator [Leptolyngbya sp. FACHB-711]